MLRQHRHPSHGIRVHCSIFSAAFAALSQLPTLCTTFTLNVGKAKTDWGGNVGKRKATKMIWERKGSTYLER